MTLVHQLMTWPVFTCSVDAPVATAVRLMWEQDCGAIPVVDEAGRLVGLVTDRDACMAAYTQGVALSEIPVSVAMSRRMLVCRPDDAILTVAQRMAEHQIRRLPVVDADGCAIGMLSINDIVRHVATPSPTQRDMLAEVMRALATIGRPRSEDEPKKVENGRERRPANETPVLMA